MKLRWALAILTATWFSPLASAHHNDDAEHAGTAAAGEDAALQAAVAGEWRSAENKARDKYRHPVESLGFWGLAPGMSIYNHCEQTGGERVMGTA